MIPLRSWLFVFVLLVRTISGRAVLPHPPPPHVDSTDRVPLRILPLGASITWGKNSPTGNGYRGFLRDKLRYAGWEVDMVGSKHHGDMGDNDVEAHPGDTINKVKAASVHSYRYKPNVVLINAGTNDCRLNNHISTAGDRMRSLIEGFLNAEDTDTEPLIVLSTLLPSGQRSIAKNAPLVNDQYRELVETMREEGVSIVLAEMNGEESAITYPEDYTTDGKVNSTHPNDRGYEKMARIWYEAIVEAAKQNLIPEPGAIEGSSTGVCKKANCSRCSAEKIFMTYKKETTEPRKSSTQMPVAASSTPEGSHFWTRTLV
ncbi:SGNH hydrolase-type esterase domain-containing protein [Aspergillus recurvatus]